MRLILGSVFEVGEVKLAVGFWVSGSVEVGGWGVGFENGGLIGDGSEDGWRGA